jgi:hypothetical protein
LSCFGSPQKIQFQWLWQAHTRTLPIAHRFNYQCFIVCPKRGGHFTLSHQAFAQHPWWENQRGWKNLLNNLRLIGQPMAQAGALSLQNRCHILRKNLKVSLVFRVYPLT